MDLSRFIDFGINDILFNGLREYFLSKDMCCDEGGHPNQDANYIIGQNIVDKIGGKIMDKNDFYNIPVI